MAQPNALELNSAEVARFFIALANETGSFVSNLKLQKLVYYAQAWHLALEGQALFSEDFQAWVHGPVLPGLYQQYKQFGWKPIIEAVKPEEVELPAGVLSFLDEVASEYFACDAYALEQMTHAEDPWLRARGDLPADEPSNEVIQKQWMQEFYSARAEEE